MSVTLSGSSITFNNGATQSLPGVPHTGLSGNLQGSSRFNATTYTNSTGRMLVVMLQTSNQPANGQINCLINGQTTYINDYGTSGSMTYFIPPGATYSFTNNSATVQGWYEM